MTIKRTSFAVLRARIVALLVAAVALGIASASASAATASPHLALHTLALPTHFSSGDDGECLNEGTGGLPQTVPSCDSYQVAITNSSSVPTAASIVATDTLPAGMSVVGVDLFWSENGLKVKLPVGTSAGWELFPVNREGEPTSLCVTKSAPVRVSCEFPPEVGVLHPDQRLQMDVYVTVDEGAVAGENQVTVSEGGVEVASESEEAVIDSTSPPFGVNEFVSEIQGAGGAGDTQAGDHPFGLATRIDFDSAMQVTTENKLEVTAVDQPRDVVVDLPLGFVGSAVATPKCTFGQLQSLSEPCPIGTAVGFLSTEPHGLIGTQSGVYSMIPEYGAAAQFGVRDLLHNTHVIDAGVVPTPSGYVVQVVAHEVPQTALASIITSFYGNPPARQEEAEKLEGKTVAPTTPTSLFTNPADCSGTPLKTTVYTDSWQHPGAFEADGSPDVEGPGWASKTVEWPAVTGCDKLHFDPSLALAPESEHRGADEPAGYEAVLTLPQSEKPGTLATPPLKTAVVTLPAGVSISPSAANGLAGCQESGTEGIDLSSPARGACPAGSKVGTIEASTPLLEERLTGSVFVAQPTCGGAGQEQCSEALAEEGKVFAIYLEVGSDERGVHVKLRGKVEVGGDGEYSRSHGLAPGQIRTSFVETPQFPVGELKLRFDGGQRAPLANPQSCGTFTTDASLEPWSAPQSGPAALARPSFEISGACADGFAPSFTAGTTNPQAGAYSAFTTTFGRQDGEQDLSGVTVDLPPGLLAKVAGVPRCAEAQANAGTCSAASQIGMATGVAGSGTAPLYQSGPVYLTGPYRGAPFGLSVVVPANAGPYHLGNIVERAAISVNSTTAAVTVTADPLPQSIDGVPIRLKTVNVTVGTNDGFTLNATDCSPSSVGATLSGTHGGTAQLASAYEPSGCASMKFAPVFSASTMGKASKAGGASLDVKVAYPTGPAGSYANIKSVKVDLPKQLPSYLPTLQKACLAATFAANPASCPASSVVGTATAATPLLNAPLSGPAYIVSHAGEAFPSLEIVLQGEGITLVLTGTTDIKHGITSNTFTTIPDAPVTSFELKLPTGKNHILATDIPEKDYFNLCGQTLNMPTSITAQNGAVIKQTTKIAILGCPKAHKAKAAKHATKASKSNRKGE
ncbi:MAG TPA: hypothetical protein VGY13_06765 [Solirubrobacteraceae bacterium]|nr:hypothetical protein [Solirubrobacteraceae bacterium]